MELLTLNHSSYPRIGSSPDEQVLRRAIGQHDRGERTEEEVRAAEDHLVLLALQEQQEAGMDVVTDGMIRWNDPVSHLAGRIEGTRINGLLRFFDTNFYFHQPVVVGKVERSRPLVVEEYKWAAQRSPLPLKPVLTGPCTLARLSVTEEKAIATGRLIMSYGEALAAEVAVLAAAGAKLIQVDEPALLRHPADITATKEALALLASFKGNAELVLATFFGDAAPTYHDLQTFPIDTLILDFTYSPALPQVIESDGSTKRLGFGVLDGRNTRLEDQGAVARSVERMITRVAGERHYLTTSCGLEYLPRDRARLKLRHLTSLKHSLLGEAS